MPWPSIGIGIFNDLFYGRSHISVPREMSIPFLLDVPFLLDEKPTVVPVSSAGERSGGARGTAVVALPPREGVRELQLFGPRARSRPRCAAPRHRSCEF